MIFIIIYVNALFIIHTIGGKFSENPALRLDKEDALFPSLHLDHNGIVTSSLAPVTSILHPETTLKMNVNEVKQDEVS
jgi:hypothetical protein